jgi:hypothetical protein
MQSPDDGEDQCDYDVGSALHTISESPELQSPMCETPKVSSAPGLRALIRAVHEATTAHLSPFESYKQSVDAELQSLRAVASQQITSADAINEVWSRERQRLASEVAANNTRVSVVLESASKTVRFAMCLCVCGSCDGG